MVGETVVMNATATGVMGLTNLANQSGTIGTVLGGSILIGIVLSAFYFSHDYHTNKKGWLWKAWHYLIEIGFVKMVIGGATVCGVWSFVNIVDWMGKNITTDSAVDVVSFLAYPILGIAALIMIGYITEPFYNWAWQYAFNTKKSVKSHD
jgi:predicted membrane protein